MDHASPVATASDPETTAPRTQSSRDVSRALPPGPSLPGWAGSLAYLFDVYRFFGALRARYGDTFTLQSAKGPLVVTGDPALVRDIFTAPAETFRVWGAGSLAPFLGDRSLLLSHGDRHKRDRKLLAPPFHGNRMRAYGVLIRDTTLAHLAKLPLGRVTPVQPTMQAISLDVILRAVFGVEDPAAILAWRKAILADVRAATPAILFLEWLRRDFGGHGPWSRHLSARAHFDAMLFGETRRRRADAGAREGEDILGLILSARYDDGGAMTDEEIRDQLITLVMAGHETTATVLAWSVEWLSRLPEVRERLTAEVDALGESPSPEAIAAAPYLDAFCTEALRVHPIVPDVPREVVVPFKLGPWSIPTGTAVAVATTLLHSDERVYPEPEAFRPERWLERKPSPFSYTPFGGGPRRCLGAAFATYEMKIALATIVRTMTFEPARRAATRPARQNITIGPAKGVLVVARRR
jgi:cytochrome P450 family 110